jgi:hypothetical protein
MSSATDVIAQHEKTTDPASPKDGGCFSIFGAAPHFGQSDGPRIFLISMGITHRLSEKVCDP